MMIKKRNDIEIKENGTNIRIPIYTAIGVLVTVFVLGYRMVTYGQETYVTRATYEADTKSMSEILREIRDDLKIVKKDTVNIKTTLLVKGMKIQEVSQ